MRSPGVFLSMLLCALVAGKAGAQSFDGQRGVGDVLEVPVLTACPPLHDTLVKYQLLVAGAPAGVAAQGCTDLPGAKPAAAGDRKTAVAKVYFLLHLYGDAANPAQLTPQNSVAWRTLIGLPWDSSGFSRVRVIDLGVVDDAGHNIAIDGASVEFVWAPLWKLVLGIVAVLAVIALFLWLGASTSLLRDVGTKTDVPAAQRTFSLARTQMAWWTLIVVASYVFEWIATGTQPVVTSQALILMGMYSALGVTSRGVDLTRQTVFPPTTPHFFWDLVSDESGVALHRLQMLVFTVLVGVNFFYGVLTTVAMPTLDVPTLFLVGISGATYIGFKSTEPQPKSEDDTQAASSATADADAGKSGYSTGDAAT